jgi:hypothetical protein
MNKILLHNLSVKYQNPAPGLYNFDQLGVFFAEGGDVLITREKIPDAYISFLESIGISSQQVKFIFSPKRLPNIPDAIFTNEEITNEVISIVRGSESEWILDNFVLTEYEAKWAEKINLNFNGDPNHYYLFGNKSKFKSLAKKNNFQVPKGYESQKKIIDGLISTSLLFIRGFDEVVVKQDEGVAALGSRRITRNQFISHFSKLDRLFPDPLKVGVIPTHSRNFLVEAWYNDVVYSPSIQLHISPNKDINVLSTHAQLMYDDKMRYKGCVSDYLLEEEKLNVKIVKEGIALGEIFAAEGYRGHLSFNAISLKENQLIWTELNPRRVISSYPFQIRKRLYGVNAKKIKYMSRHVMKKEWRGKPIEFVLDALAPVLFTRKNKQGIVPFDYSLLSSEGQLSLVGFSEDVSELNKMFRYVDAA